MNRRKNKKIESSRIALVEEFYIDIKIANSVCWIINLKWNWSHKVIPPGAKEVYGVCTGKKSISSYILFRRTIQKLLAYYRYTWEEISFISSKIWNILEDKDGIKKEFQRICSSVDKLFKNKRQTQPLQIN